MFLRVFLSDKASRHHLLKTLCKTFVERRYARKTFSASTTAQVSLCLAVGVTVSLRGLGNFPKLPRRSLEKTLTPPGRGKGGRVLKI